MQTQGKIRMNEIIWMKTELGATTGDDCPESVQADITGQGHGAACSNRQYEWRFNKSTVISAEKWHHSSLCLCCCAIFIHLCHEFTQFLLYTAVSTIIPRIKEMERTWQDMICFTSNSSTKEDRSPPPSHDPPCSQLLRYVDSSGGFAPAKLQVQTEFCLSESLRATAGASLAAHIQP